MNLHDSVLSLADSIADTFYFSSGEPLVQQPQPCLLRFA